MTCLLLTGHLKLICCLSHSYYVEHSPQKANRQPRVFEVFNVKVKLLHDSFSYQTIRHQLPLLLVIANAISSLFNYRNGAAKKQCQPHMKRTQRREK